MAPGTKKKMRNVAAPVAMEGAKGSRLGRKVRGRDILELLEGFYPQNNAASTSEFPHWL